MVLPGALVSLVTFPGVVLHEWAHRWACERYGVAVYEVVYFRFGDPAGYVLHAEPARFREAFAISAAPFLVNSLLAVALVVPLPYFRTLMERGSPPGFWLTVTAAWLALSVGMHAVPSRTDARAVWDRMWQDWRLTPFVLLAAPIVGLIYLFDLARVVWADLLLAVLLVGAGLLIGLAVI